jgi:hypothetical protein
MSFKKIDFSQAGGLYTYQDTLAWIQDAPAQLLDAIAKFIGDKVILYGLEPTGVGTEVTEGWVSLNGELLRVQAGSQLNYLFVSEMIDADRLEQFADGVQRTVYSNRSLKFTNTAAGNYAFNTFTRLGFNGTTLKDVFDKVTALVKDTIALESAVIVNGCEVTNVNVGASTCDIAAGIVLFDGDYVATPQRIGGSYPCYLKSDGTFVTAVPAGTYITFDYETSQRFKHVVKRWQHESGEIVMSKSANDLALFDVATGLGKWKWLGWKLCDALRSRVPVGYDRRTVDPNDNVYDAANNTLGSNYGEKKHTLSISEIPAHHHEEQVFSAINNGGRKPVGYTDTDNDFGGSGYNTADTGGGQSHENRQPSNVILFIERI